MEAVIETRSVLDVFFLSVFLSLIFHIHIVLTWIEYFAEL